MLFVSETTEHLGVENKNLGHKIVGNILTYCDDNKILFCLIKNLSTHLTVGVFGCIVLV